MEDMDHNYLKYRKFHNVPTDSQDNSSKLNKAATLGCQAPLQLALVFSDGVLLAAEKRVTYGYFIMSKGGKKVFKVTDRIGVACAGLVGDMQILAKEMEAQANLFSMDTGQKNQCTFSIKTYGKCPLQPSIRTFNHSNYCRRLR